MTKTRKPLKERMRERKRELEARNKKGSIFFPKEGEHRIRILNMGEDEDFVVECTVFYLGAELGGHISPSTFGLPCALMEKYQKLSKSKKDSDKEFAKKMAPKTKPYTLVLRYKDLKGKEIDEENSPKLMQLAQDPYQQILNLYLDEDDWGDMTDPKTGYDLKYTRTGKGRLDTEYSVTPYKNTPLPKSYLNKRYNLVEEIKKVIPSYEETEDLLNRFMSVKDTGDENGDESPRERLRKKKSLKKKRSE